MVAKSSGNPKIVALFQAKKEKEPESKQIAFQPEIELPKIEILTMKPEIPTIVPEKIAAQEGQAMVNVEICDDVSDEHVHLERGLTTSVKHFNTSVKIEKHKKK